MGSSTTSIAVPFKIHIDDVNLVPNSVEDSAENESKNGWFIIDCKDDGDFHHHTITRNGKSIFVDAIQKSPIKIVDAVSMRLDEAKSVFLINESEWEESEYAEWSVFAFNREILEQFITDLELDGPIVENDTVQQTA